ncbi:hypothetical protein LOC68_11080 [Blastopirellula sp. JC732]|uniref:Uncharacterized protein n=1 Tax=Blastopirellula sediminis TaxID=2894196 RepID=A0A9X1MN50_9BACT|nr:hypothetical protein [Blastopirellula sediminis]MCC9608271.1 hypothetical protein [Blastopirellula sediminis]MCC9628942.1 hypothetical protein [Blastopirellula sediminis]
MNLPQASAQSVARELKKRHFPGQHVLPYNRFSVENSTHWWLSPTGDKGAFRYGKYILTTDGGWLKEGTLFCGWNIEKGMLHSGSWPASNVMNKSWHWHKFLLVANEPLVQMMDEARAATDGDLQLVVCAGMPGAETATVVMSVNGSRLKPAAYQASDGILVDLARSADMATFVDALRKLDGAPTAWHWIDIRIGQAFTLDRNGPDQLDDCARMLKPFQRWVHS